ncbi:MAG: hypothetical protein U9Q67_00005, partial [Patescibacteria group bacterium]|nr:hypothetical protein [Patescibacteria group bacterium]
MLELFGYNKTRRNQLLGYGIALTSPCLLLPVLFISISFLLSLFFAPEVSASINPKISYQGKLTDNNGRAVSNANYDMKLVLYDAVTGGNCV